LCPGTLSPANKALLQGDHVYILGSGAFEYAGGPDDFFDLLRGLVPDDEAGYLLTPREFLGTDVVVSEEAAYKATETDIEIELDE